MEPELGSTRKQAETLRYLFFVSCFEYTWDDDYLVETDRKEGFL